MAVILSSNIYLSSKHKNGTLFSYRVDNGRSLLIVFILWYICSLLNSVEFGIFIFLLFLLLSLIYEYIFYRNSTNYFMTIPAASSLNFQMTFLFKIYYLQGNHYCQIYSSLSRSPSTRLLLRFHKSNCRCLWIIIWLCHVIDLHIIIVEIIHHCFY